MRGYGAVAKDASRVTRAVSRPRAVRDVSRRCHLAQSQARVARLREHTGSRRVCVARARVSSLRRVAPYPPPRFPRRARRSLKATRRRAQPPPSRAFLTRARARALSRASRRRTGTFSSERAGGQRRRRLGGGKRCRSGTAGERGRGGAPFPDGLQASLSLLACFRAERAHLLRAHLRGVPQGQVLHHRARAPRPVACRRVWVLYRKRLSFFHYFCQTVY